jgi:hypothetical protein
MEAFTLRYRHNTSPQRGLATAGILIIKSLLILPHMIVTGLLLPLSFILAYFGYWAVAFSGEMPQAVHRWLETSLGWFARMWAWIAGVVDIYPPFETDPDFPASFPVSRPDKPARGWAVAGLLFVPKVIMAIPHIIVLFFLGVAALIAMWVGYLIAAFTGSLPTGLQDFMAGVLQWDLRVAAWFTGLSDEYPPFSLDASPTTGSS